MKGSPIPPSSNALETPPPQNDDQVKTAATAAKEGFGDYLRKDIERNTMTTTLLTCSKHMSTFAASATLYSGKSPVLGRSLTTTLLRSSTSLTIPSLQSALYSGVG